MGWGRDPESTDTPCQALQYLPHFTVGCGEHPAFADQHSSTVELITSEQGHLPWMGPFFTWVAIYNSFSISVTLVWTETETHMGIQHQRETDTKQGFIVRDGTIVFRRKGRGQEGEPCRGGEGGQGRGTRPLRKPHDHGTHR